MATKKGNGYAGKILRVDLTSGRFSDVVLSEDELKKWVGGAGLGAKFLYDEVPPGTAWNAPENRLIFTSGPLAGTNMVGSGTINICLKGPLTNGATSTQANGFMGAYMKFSGYDGVIFQGAAKDWVYLYLHDGKAELKDARKYLGMDTWKTEDAIKADLGYTEKQMSVFCIGPAGENLVKFAGVFGDKNHAAGHNGSGAVMASKKLKAICAARPGRVAVFDPEGLTSAVNDLWAAIEATPNGKNFIEWGTGGNYAGGERRPLSGTLPTKNYTTNIFPESRIMVSQYSREHHEVKVEPCWACRMKHQELVTFKDGPYKGLTVEEPEYELWAAMSSLVGITNPEDTMFLANLLTLLGLEGNEAGYIVSMAIELYEKGFLKQEDTDGLELTWGNSKAVQTLLERISRREGAFANNLAEGIAKAAEKLGPQAQEFGIYALKGHAPRGHDHRAMWREMFDTATSDIATYSAGYAGTPDPDSHSLKQQFGDGEQVSTHVALTKGRRQFEDCTGTCAFCTRMTPISFTVAAFNAATGWNFTPKDAANVGYRLSNVFRAFNLRNGIGPELEKYSPRWASAPVDGPAKGVTIAPQWESMLDNYYKLMGWDRKTGRPLPETLKSLGLEYIIKDLYK